MDHTVVDYSLQMAALWGPTFWSTFDGQEPKASRGPLSVQMMPPKGWGRFISCCRCANVQMCTCVTCNSVLAEWLQYSAFKGSAQDLPRLCGSAPLA